MIAVVAALLWSRCCTTCNPSAGYASVAANHRRIWWAWLAGGMAFGCTWGIWGCLRALLEWAVWVLVAAILTRSRGAISGKAAITLLGMIFALALTGGGCDLGLRCAIGNRADRQCLGHSILGISPVWAMLIVWWLGLSLTTPLYRPYARLSLPWLVASWLLVGVACERLAANPLLHLRFYVGMFSCRCRSACWLNSLAARNP